MKAETKYRGSIKLSAIGDALGWITEFEKSSASLLTKYGTETIGDFHDWQKRVGGRFNGYVDRIKAGSYSDDTQLLLAVARSIGRNGIVDNRYFGKVELSNWLDYARGGGRTVKIAANKISRKSAEWYSNFYHYKVNGETFDYRQSGANGAAMRILPIALVNLGNFENLKSEIFCNSIVTHGHPRAIVGALLYGYAINQIIVYRPESFGWEQYIKELGTDFLDKFALRFDVKSKVSQWLMEWNRSYDQNFEELYIQTLAETQEYLRIIYQSLKKGESSNETIKKLGCFEPATKGSGISTVVAGIYFAAKFSEKPLDGITEAVNALGTDTDSIAAFTGGLLGGLHGHGIIPDRWKGVQDSEYLDHIAERLLAISEDRWEDSNLSSLPTPVARKQINRLEADNFAIGDTIHFHPLGSGTILEMERQPTLTRRKYNLVIGVQLDTGQSIVVSKLFVDMENDTVGAVV